MSFTPRSILITGASSGIGRALAREYAAAGVRLTLVGRDAARLEAVAAECRAKGAGVEIGQVDVRDRQGMHDFLRAADQNGVAGVIEMAETVTDELRVAMFCAGAENITALGNTPLHTTYFK